jgi:hypothetical protein
MKRKISTNSKQCRKKLFLKIQIRCHKVCVFLMKNLKYAYIFSDCWNQSFKYYLCFEICFVLIFFKLWFQIFIFNSKTFYFRLFNLIKKAIQDLHICMYYMFIWISFIFTLISKMRNKKWFHIILYITTKNAWFFLNLWIEIFLLKNSIFCVDILNLRSQNGLYWNFYVVRFYYPFFGWYCTFKHKSVAILCTIVRSGILDPWSISSGFGPWLEPLS